jgi:hypothetical protein
MSVGAPTMLTGRWLMAHSLQVIGAGGRNSRSDSLAGKGSEK